MVRSIDLELRNCTVCGRPFRPLVGNQKKCVLCKGYQKREKVYHTEVCIVCGKEFETHLYNKRFCGKQCRSKYHYNPEIMTKVCKNCGKVFETSQHRQVFCSPTCRNNSYKPMVVQVEKASTPTTQYGEELEDMFGNEKDTF
jgi:hypothetical protein